MDQHPLQSVLTSPISNTFADLIHETKERSAEFEAQRHLSLDYVQRLKQEKYFRILVPREANGMNAGFKEWLKVVEQFAVASPSVGWSVAHGNIASAVLYARASPELRERFFGQPLNTSALTNLTRMDAEMTSDGLRISGSWGFVTGSMTSDYIAGLVKLPREGKTNEPAPLKTVVVPRDAVEVVDTWNPIGLAGTGSHDVAADNLLVPWEYIIDWPAPWQPGPSTSKVAPALDACIPGTWLISLIPAATHLGIARAALDECRQGLSKKRGTYTGNRLVENSAVLRDIENAEARLLSCQAFFHNTLDDIWRVATLNSEVDGALRRKMRLASVHTVHETHDVVRTAFQAGGAAAISKKGKLERLYRDASCLISHVSVARESLETTGRAAFDLDEGAWL